jgi:hypothetical protein
MKVIVYKDFNYTSKIKKAIIIFNYKSYSNIYFIKNGKVHSGKYASGYEIYKKIITKHYHFNDHNYRRDFDFPDKSWRKKVIEIKRENKLKVFL